MNNPKENETGKSKRSFLRAILAFVVILLLAISLLIFSTPTVLSSRWGQDQLLSYLNNQIPGTVELSHLDVSWFGNQQINGLVLKDPSGNVVASMDSLATDSPLIDLFRGDFINSKLKINGLNATISQDQSGNSNVHKALGVTLSNSQESSIPLAIQLKDVHADISMSGKHNPILISIKGLTAYGTNEGSFEVNAVAGGLTSDKIEKLDLTIRNVPIVLLDQLVSLENLQYRGLLTEGLGESLDATLVQTKVDQGMNLALDITTKHLKAVLNGKIVADQFSLNQPGKVSFLMQPAFLNHAAGYQNPKALPLEITIDKLNFPLSDGSAMKLDTAFQGTLDRIPFDFDVRVAGSDVIVEMKGDRMQGRLPFTIGNEISLTEPGYIQMRITPERYQSIRRYINGKGHLADLELTETTNMRIDVKEFRLPPRGISDAAFKVDVVLDTLNIDDTKTGRQVDLDKISITVNSGMLRKKVDFTINNPQINLKGYVHNPYDFNDMIVGTQGSFKNLPAGLLCELACFESRTRLKIESLLGPQIDGTINIQLAQWNGPVRANVSGANGRFDLDGKMTNGVLTLNKPFTAEVKPTPELGQSILEDIIPILSGLVSGNDRIKLYVSNEGFSMPVNNFDLAYMEIGGLSLGMGRVQFTNEGELGKIMSALKARTGEYIDVWFTPIYLSASQGVINISRFDLLAMQRYHIAVWGQVNMPYDRIDMTIGLSGASLSSTLGIKIPDKNYMMQFPLKGSIGHASVDKSKVMAKVAALGTSIAGGPQGMVVGAVIGLATGTLNEPAAPSPTTEPFPWKDVSSQDQQSSYDQDNNNNAQTSDNETSRSKNPVKGLKKEAGKVLKNIFR